MDFPPLESLGPRIMVCGPSNAGKSTLAVAISRKLGVPTVHLDRLHHLPHTDWVPRPEAEFVRLHEAAIAEERWVMDGNYSRLFPPRLARATGIVLLDDNRWLSLGRYARRTLLQRDRAGALDGAKDSLKWQMVRWIMIAAPRNMVRYREQLGKSGLPLVEVQGMRALSALYGDWRLTRD